jgi:hypothetical protein
MAELYQNPKQYLTARGSVGNVPTNEPSFEDMLAELPPEEREEAMQYITAPPSGEEIMKAMQEKNSRGEVMDMTVDQYRLYKAYNKTKEVDIIAGIGEGAGAIFDDIQRAAGSIVNDPSGALTKLTPSVVEAFAQGTRYLYGMAAQSADPNSVFFRMKNALQANGDDEQAEFQQFMEAQAFNVHSMRLMNGQDTIIMDKDIINPEMTQVMSYIADPTLFIPFGGIVAKGATMIGMGEKLALAASRTSAIRNMVLGGTIKWGVGAPLEFMGGAIRNTIDYGIETGSRAIETATGVSAKEIQSATRVGTIGTAAASTVGLEVNSALGQVSKLYAGSGIARNVGEAASIYGEQMMKQGVTGRGILGYAGQAIRDTERAGIKLTPQVKGLLKSIEAVDPLFVYADDIATGAAHGAMIGGGLGYLTGGEEGMAHGLGAGLALGTIGAGVGKVVSDVTGNTKLDQMAIQRKLIVEALKENGNENAVGFEAMVAMAEATGDRAFQGYIDGIIAGIDTVNPDAVFKAFNKVQYEVHLKSKGIDPNTGVLLEKSRIFPELVDRTVKADVLGVLRDTGNRFAGDPDGFERAIKTAPEFSKLKPVWNKLDDNAKQVILKQIKDNGDVAFVKSLKGRQLNAHWSDLAYSERLTEMINTLNQKNANSVPDKVKEILKAETRSDKKLTRRGQMLKEKLQADGYIDKDGNIRQRRLADVEATEGEFTASAGWTKRRDSNGRTEVVINLDKWAMDTGNRLALAHELYHSIMMDSVFAPDYIDRLSQKLLGKFDPKTGKILEQALVQPDELMKFFSKYIDNDPNNKGDAETIKRKKEELKKSIEEYRTRGTANRVADSTAIPLEHLVEEFGAYYFSKWVKAQPIDFLFRGGEFGGIRGLMEMASDGWLDYWKGKVGEKNPQFNFDGMGVSSVSKAFEKDGKRVSSRSLDLFMRDIVRIEANRNSSNGFDINKLSNESREWFLKVNGLRGSSFGQMDKQGNVKRPRLRKYTAEEIRQGKEMFKVLESLPDAAHKDGMRRDGDGNWSGQPNTAQINALVGAGYIQRAWFDRMTRAYDIVNGNGSNVVEFGYLGYSAGIGDSNERVYGAAVPFKNRRAVLIGVDFKVRADGTVFSNLHTLDLKVIEARGNEVWKDPQTRELWKENRTNMEADFYAYLSNASLPSNHPDRKPSARLLDKGDGLGGQRRDALHQMLGFHKGSDLPYINRPIAEIPVGIRHSVTTFSNDGIVNMRVDNKPRYDFNFENAHLDLSRNFMPDEMRQETTPSGGKIIRHATGYNISKQAGEKFKVFDPEGKMLGAFDTVADAGRAAQKHFNDTFDKSVEGKDPAVPPTETPPSRQAYIQRKQKELLSNSDIKDKVINEITSKKLKNDPTGTWHSAIDLIEREGVASAFSKMAVLHNLESAKSFPYAGSLGAEYDAMYPMEIKSALYPRLAQIFQDHPNLTAQGLLKKLVTYGSRGSRFFQEATEIGLVDILKAKVQRTTSPMRMEDGRVIQMARGGETQPKLDIAEILDFAKSKEIRVTIEEGAREVSGMDTSRYTLGGAKDNYKQTAIRINPEYAHGIRGHYGEDTIVHFRTTERLDADGNKHLFIEEVQANNTDKRKVSGRLSPDREFIVKRNIRTQKHIFEKGKEAGIYLESTEREGYVTEKKGYLETGQLMQGGLGDEIGKIISEIIPQQGYDFAMDRKEIRRFLYESFFDVFETIGRVTDFKNFVDRLDTEISQYAVVDEKPNARKKLLNSKELENQFNKIREMEIRREAFYQEEVNANIIEEGSITNYNLDNPDNMLESITDNESILQKHELSLSEKEPTPLPLTAAKDWTLTGLKGIIRQAIRDGLDRITLTHPDDSPTVSHMKGDARQGLYGKLIPEVWGAWLRKYGIEIKQTNKLADATIDTAKGQMAEITNKLHDANKAVLEHFEQVGNMENPTVIQKVSELLATPVHEVGRDIETVVQKASEGINDVKLKTLVNEVGILKGGEKYHYEKINELREQGIRGTSKASGTDAGISAEAIDRGMTFELNDRIKREFIEGRINTHSMPAEDVYSGGRVYDQNSKQFKSGFVGLYAAENPDRVNGVSLQFMKRKDGSHRIRLTDNSKKGESADIGHITANISGDTATLSTNINKEYRGRKLAYVVYSEMAERLRSMGIKSVDGQIVNPDGVPVYVREQIIGDTRDYNTGKPIGIDEAARRIQARQKDVGSMGGVDVYNKLYKDGRYMPAEGEQVGNKGRYDIDEAIVEKLKEKFKGYRNLTAKDMLEFIIENKGQFSPLAERLLESLDKHGLEAFVQQQTSTLGRNQKGTKGWTYHNYNPNNNTVNMLLERNVQRRRGWTLSFEELMMEEILHAVSFEKVPEPIKHGVTIEDTSKTVDHFLRNKEKYSSRYDDVWKTELGFSQEWFTIADAYKQVLKQFESGKFLDGTVIDKTAKHNISYRLSNMAEFIVGITQDKDVQTILSQIKVPKSEKSFLTKLLDAIKRIWNFDDSVIDSLLAVTSDAAERVIHREKHYMEKVGTGIFRDRAKQYFGGMPEPKFQPAEENALVQNGFEKSELNKQLLASGHIVLGFDERTLEGKAVVINNPDTMMTGTLETPSGKILAEGEGGLNFVSKFADIWANSKEAKAKTTANNLKKAQQENGGVAYLSLTRGSFENALNSHTGAKAGMGILEYFVEQGYISLEEFRNALKDSGRKYGIEFNATRSAKDIHSEIASKFFGVSDSTFERRGDFVKDVITHLAENGESGHKNIDKISEALGANRLGRKIQFAPTGIREAIGLMLSDKRANVDPSHVYAYIEITGNISVEKTENGHKSYPWHIVQRDDNGNKIRPRMLIPDKTNYVTDVFLNKNKQEVPRKGGATKLGSNQVGEAYGYVKPAANIPEGKPRLAWQPAEYMEFTSEQTSVGRILRNAKGYAIILANNKFRVYNPAKSILGIYNSEEEAKKRIYREIPKQ